MIYVSFKEKNGSTVAAIISTESQVDIHILTNNRSNHQRQSHLNTACMLHSTTTLASDQPNDPAIVCAHYSRPRAQSFRHAVCTWDATYSRQPHKNAVDAEDVAVEIEKDVIEWDLIQKSELSFVDGTSFLAE